MTILVCHDLRSAAVLTSAIGGAQVVDISATCAVDSPTTPRSWS
jgi:hypothetical protein